jgi:hypothetical protein
MLAVSRIDGWSVVIVAALSAVVSLVQGSWFPTGIALLVLMAGGAELRGRGQLVRGRVSGLAWMIGAQWGLLLVIWIYAWWRWRTFDPAALWAELPGFARTKIDHDLLAAGLDPESERPLLLGMVNTLTCLALVLVSLLFQGGLALYYGTQRQAASEALITGRARPPGELVG